MSFVEATQILGNLGEFVGAIAVVVTLAYLAVQVRLGREATEAHTRSLRSVARFEAGRYWSEETIRLALSPDMASIVAAAFEDASQLSDEARERWVAWCLQHALMKDTLYHQYIEGVLPEDVWHAHEAVTIGLANTESFNRVWDAGHIPVSEDFRRYFERLRDEKKVSSWSFENKARLFDEPPQPLDAE